MVETSHVKPISKTHKQKRFQSPAKHLKPALFHNIVNSFQSLAIFAETFISELWQNCEYASDKDIKRLKFIQLKHLCESWADTARNLFL